MPRKKLDTINLEEFNRRLDAHNERMRMELEAKEAKQNQVEQLLTHYEKTLDEIEARLHSEQYVSLPLIGLRKRLQELAAKTAEMAASL